ncbi:MAG: class I SAM-dependent methyltransferase, partial [bacterium]
MKKDEFRRASKNVWEKMAEGWDVNREYMWETSKPVGEWLVEKLAPRDGQTLLELAAGVGDTGFVAAGLIGAEGCLISTDFAPSMVDGARRRADELGITNAEFRVMDAENMDLYTESVDGVLCRWGYMLMSDPGAAFKETRRVLRPGGRLCFSVFAGPE